MSWAEVHPDVRALIWLVCTQKQREALQLKAMGVGNHRIARILGISVTAVKERLAGGARKIQCPSPGCPQLLHLQDAPPIARCPTHGPMRELAA